MFHLNLQVEEMDSLVEELVSVTEKEKVLLKQCKHFLSMLAAIQVIQASSLIFHPIFCFIGSL